MDSRNPRNTKQYDEWQYVQPRGYYGDHDYRKPRRTSLAESSRYASNQSRAPLSERLSSSSPSNFHARDPKGSFRSSQHNDSSYPSNKQPRSSSLSPRTLTESSRQDTHFVLGNFVQPPSPRRHLCPSERPRPAVHDVPTPSPNCERYFIVKLEKEEQLEEVKNGLCMLPSHNQLARQVRFVMNDAWDKGGTLFVLVGVSKTKGFQGYGKMTSRIKRNEFGIKWIKTGYVEFSELIDLHNPWKKQIPISESQYGHELPYEAGVQVCQVIDTKTGNEVWKRKQRRTSLDVMLDEYVLSAMGNSGLSSIDTSSFCYQCFNHFLWEDGEGVQFPHCKHALCWSCFDAIAEDKSHERIRCPYCLETTDVVSRIDTSTGKLCAQQVELDISFYRKFYFSSTTSHHKASNLDQTNYTNNISHHVSLKSNINAASNITNINNLAPNYYTRDDSGKENSDPNRRQHQSSSIAKSFGEQQIHTAVTQAITAMKRPKVFQPPRDNQQSTYFQEIPAMNSLRSISPTDMSFFSFDFLDE